MHPIWAALLHEDKEERAHNFAHTLAAILQVIPFFYLTQMVFLNHFFSVILNLSDLCFLFPRLT